MSSKCPCCSSSLLRHWKNDGMYWFCSHCRQEMPNLSTKEIKKYHHKRGKILKKSMIISKQFATRNSTKIETVKT